MKSIKLKNSALLILVVILASACSNTKETPAASATADTTEVVENPTTVALSDLQIKTANIAFGKITNKELTATLKANGVLRVPNDKKANVTSLYGGVIKNLNVQIGDYVAKGQVIARIENPQFLQLQEEYVTNKSRIELAKQELKRQRELNAGNAGTMRNLQNATNDVGNLLTRNASLKKQIALMGINADQISNSNLRSSMLITSPISGTISNIVAKVGSYVDVSSPVAEIVDNNFLHLDLQVFEKDLPTVKVGQTIHFTVTNNPQQEYDAKIFSIGSSFENDSKTVAVHCNVINKKTGLIDGMNITGVVSLNNTTLPAVPAEAIVDAEGKSFIFVVLTDKKAADKHTNFKRVEVIKGVTSMGYTAITAIAEIGKDAQIVSKGAYFVNAKMSSGEGEHEH